MEEPTTSTPEQIAKNLATYVGLRIDALKLSIVENLSHIFSSAIGLLIFVLLLFMAVMMLTALLTFWLGLLLGSMAWAIIIMALFYFVAAVVVFAMRQRLIADRMAKMFSQMFFNSEPRGDE